MEIVLMIHICNRITRTAKHVHEIIFLYMITIINYRGLMISHKSFDPVKSFGGSDTCVSGLNPYDVTQYDCRLETTTKKRSDNQT